MVPTTFLGASTLWSSCIDLREADFDLHERIANALHWNLAIPHDRISVSVVWGLVTLRGVVERAYERSFAEADARRVPGVTEVRNEIVVRGGDPAKAN